MLYYANAIAMQFSTVNNVPDDMVINNHATTLFTFNMVISLQQSHEKDAEARRPFNLEPVRKSQSKLTIT